MLRRELKEKMVDACQKPQTRKQEQPNTSIFPLEKFFQRMRKPHLTHRAPQVQTS